ncbi:hypothetical protein MJO28_014794 [Puccinia striiformis f. sp. tritici]|uniref:Uncharacterized protein n=1 Tax=Puccinia striiformis f. sp. tritici TaxID=168172 RepID=A0ACC0DUG5_9BASI|nr:hypothetical protein MJO28_014794 [Puccinia striiformis f. sp. tritici]
MLIYHPEKTNQQPPMNILSLIIYLSCATTPAVLAAGATTTPDPKTTVAFTCADAKDQPTGWCVTEVKSRFVHGLYNFAEANAVGPAKNLNYNCIGKPFAENSVCCRSTYKPKPNVLNSFTSQDCQIKKSIGT